MDILNEENYQKILNDTLVASFVHDLKNPLFAQKKTLELLLSGKLGELSPTQKELLELVCNSTNYLSELVASILTFYKMECSEIVLSKKWFDIEELVSICVKEFLIMAKDKNINLVFKSELSTNEKFVLADIFQIRRVIENLLSNGISYSYAYTSFDIKLYRDLNNILLSFKSTGCPIPKSLRDNIFDKYVSCSSKTLKVNYGLGLYTCKKIMDAHNGKIYLVDKEPEINFIVEIPIKNCEEVLSI